MKFFKKSAGKSKKKGDSERTSAALKSWKEIVDEMYDKDLDCVDGEVLEVIYSSDKCKRFIVFLSDKGYVSYVFEKLRMFDEEELLYFGRANYWELSGCSKSIYSTLEDAMKQLVFEPEYRAYFKEDEE